MLQAEIVGATTSCKRHRRSCKFCGTDAEAAKDTYPCYKLTGVLRPRTAFFSGGELGCNLLPLYPAPKLCGRGAREGRPGHAGDVLEEEAGFFSFSFTVRG
jgi:hypothetical protein